jgi:hypothetical protein
MKLKPPQRPFAAETPVQIGQIGQEEPGQDRSLASRFRLAMLEEYLGEQRGHNPYDTCAAIKRDVWSTKRKRA